jgi:hypothetical protein
VPVRIGAGPPQWFILDTGATATIIDAAAAKAAGLPVQGGQIVHGAGAGGSRQGHTSAVSLMVGRQPLRVSQPAVMDLAGLLGPTSGRAPAGIIGSQLFREHFVDVDFERRRITLYGAGTDRRSDFAAATALTFADFTPLVLVKLTLPDQRVVAARALVDLGAKSTFLIPEPFIDRERLRDAFASTVVTGLGAGVGGDTFYAFARARRLSLAAAPAIGLDHPVVGLSVGGTLRSTWHEGLLGAEFLSRFHIGFDYRRRLLLLTPRSASAAAFDRSGLFLASTGPSLDRIVVRQVLKGGPAEAAGLSPGDEIVAVDGRPAARLGLAGVREALKRAAPAQVAIRYRRGPEPRIARVELRDLL